MGLLARTHVSSSQDTCVFQPGHMCLLAKTHVSSSQDTCVFQPGPNCASFFLPKIMTKIGLYHFYSSAKSRRELKIKTSGVIFQGASAYYVQNYIAPPKQAGCRFSNENLHRKFLPKICFGVEK